MAYNTARPLVMHIDLNSCFATVEQQSRPLLRGRPVAIVNRAVKHTAIVTASYEAKAAGVRVGMKFREAQALVPDIIGIESDPPKYRYVYHKLLGIMRDYSAVVVMKSIDEGVIDFRHAPESVRHRNLRDVGLEIKRRLRGEIGVAMRCNIGISTNRFLAKTAAGLHKPDGMDEINYHNLRSTLANLELTDLTGIAKCNQARLNAVGIYTPLEFLDSDVVTLEKIVFKSIVGRQWHQRLRGWEVDDQATNIGRVGRQYVLESFDLTRDEIEKRLHHLCESVGSRLRRQNLQARGVYVYAKTHARRYWHTCRCQLLPFFSNQAIFTIARQLFQDAPNDIREIGVHCYLLSADDDQQLSLFGDQIAREKQIITAIDQINGCYGERTIHSANTLATGIYVKTKIPFGSTRYL